jgi:predicted Zn finger-like uncharacterized protein
VEIGSMHIICPHCTTSYAIDLATLGAAGRTVRCSRCKEVWLARPEDATEIKAQVPVMAEAQASSADAAAEWEALARESGSEEQETPLVDSPSISADWPAGGETQPESTDWPQVARHDMHDVRAPRPQRLSWFRNLLRPLALQGAPGKPFVSLTTMCAAMGALVLGLVIWRVDVVRLLPQTAGFYKMVGFDVNLRGLMFKDVKIST